MTDQTPLTDEEIEQFRRQLLQRRAEITGDMQALNAERRQQGAPDAPDAAAPDVPTHLADAGEDARNQQHMQKLAQHERDLVAEIDAAIERIRDGRFGLCAEDQHPISRRRLQAKPWARLCRQHAEAEA